ncbi:MAG TPA: hypothetical protein VGR35_21905 [Tepidisphaeraceae bacterium]|nr:hypothetical protein [Tepidisphaeraceae bacterium]
MIQFINYYGRFEGMRGRVTTLPFLARLILVIVALPGLFLLGLSIIAFVVSLLALLLLTIPVYRLMSALFLPRVEQQQRAWAEPEFENPLSPAPGRRHVEVKIVE